MIDDLTEFQKALIRIDELEAALSLAAFALSDKPNFANTTNEQRIEWLIRNAQDAS